MSADDYTPFTPHLDSLQTAWVVMCQQSRVATQPSVETLEAEFDRAIARVRAEAVDAIEREMRRLAEDFHASGNSRPLGDPGADVWHEAACLITERMSRANTITQEDTP